MKTPLDGFAKMDKKVLVITSDYPPSPGIGSLNVSKLTKYLLKQGWDVLVFTAALPPKEISSTLPLEIPKRNVFYLPWPDNSKIKNRILYLLCGNIGWFFPAVKKGLELIKSFKPNIILATSPHHISQLVAYKLSKNSRIPFISHLRDPWTIDPHFSKIRLTYVIGKLYEKRIFSSASAIIVVSEGFADFYARLSGRPVYVIHNGFDPEDFPSDVEIANIFTLVFAGSIYRGTRDVTPLLSALRNLARKCILKKFPIQIKLFLPNDDMEIIIPQLNGYPEVKDFFKLYPWTSHSVVVQEELKATSLLLPLEFNQSGWYFYSGKLFEYMGARRPILCIGSKYNLAGKLIEKLGIGRNCETAEEVEEFLLNALKSFYHEHKKEEIEWEKVKEFSWENQARKIGVILEKYAR